MVLKKADEPKNGVSIRKMNYLMAAVICVVSVVLLVSSLLTISVYTTLRNITADYFNGERNIYQMQETSDYLTEQVRSFTETGNRVYMDNYFRESEVTKRRESALEELAKSFADSDIYDSLSQAMQESTELMQTEYYAMRLIVESKEYDLSTVPEQIQQITLTKDDSEYSHYGKEKRAHDLVFSDEYHDTKEEISKKIKECMTQLMDEIEDRQAKTTDRFGAVVVVECILIVFLIAVVLGIVILTRIQVITPLTRAIPMIRDDQPIEVGGSSEFRFLAQTYNRMYEENRSRKEALAYEASHDPLTGVLNRKGFEKLMQTTDFREVALLLIDIDHFKNVNDTYGHEIGDRLLVRVTGTVKRSFRTGDSLCRVGGDEFVLFMFGTGKSETALIREKVEQINNELGESMDGVPATSVSVGVAFGNIENGDALYKRADEALYRVKENGRHGCAFADEK